jgi:SAM-dependent methyltransferase
MRTVSRRFDTLSASGAWSQLYATSNGDTYHYHVRRMRVLDLLPEKLGNVADVGCGPGVMTEAVLERGGTFDGIDVSQEMVNEASAKIGPRPGVRFFTGNVEALDLPSDGYDQVICMGVLEYLKAPDRAMAEIARTLRPGGCVVVTVPKRWHLDRVAYAVTKPLRRVAAAAGVFGIDPLTHRHFQASELDSVARRAGLVPDGGSYYHFGAVPYPFSRLLPALKLRLSLPLERWHATPSLVTAVFAQGYIGRYRKPA